MNRQIEEVISEAEIQKRIEVLATEIVQEYDNKQVLLVGVLKGSVIFLADLVRELWRQQLTDVEIDFIGISSYENGDTESSKNPRITMDLSSNVRGRHVLLVEDVVDTGYSLEALTRLLTQRQPASIKTAVLLSKISRREVGVRVDYVGFEIDGWIEGYGLDTDEKFRGRPNIVLVK
jgi:hypoxanthine phosphoribosyltransferase